jgi:hypothetical protein
MEGFGSISGTYGFVKIRTNPDPAGPKIMHETSCPKVKFQPCLRIAKVQNAVNNILFFSIWKKEVALKLQRIVRSENSGSETRSLRIRTFAAFGRQRS